ncbi:MAG: DUF6515 family protein [Sulfurospirillaceae bacterium]|nr:DUF6515 family protein [Sulfurospirillaceae bacterium]
MNYRILTISFVLLSFVGVSLNARSWQDKYDDRGHQNVKKETKRYEIRERYENRHENRIETRRYYNTVPKYHKPIPADRRWGRVIYRRPVSSIFFSFGGLGYYYDNGIFYRPYNGNFIIVMPPIGAIVPVLPIGCSVVSIYGRNYYYYDNTYYEWAPSYNGYRVVDPSVPQNIIIDQGPVINNSVPVDSKYAPGNIFYKLPAGATQRILNGVSYYWFEGHYFSKTVKDGREIYIVVSPR